jgi:hypothetical protein
VVPLDHAEPPCGQASCANCWALAKRAYAAKS